MATLASLAAKVQKIEGTITPEPVIHVFVFLGFDGHNASTSRTETRGPKGERFIYLGFEPILEPPLPSRELPGHAVKPTRRTRQRPPHTPKW